MKIAAGGSQDKFGRSETSSLSDYILLSTFKTQFQGYFSKGSVFRSGSSSSQLPKLPELLTLLHTLSSELYFSCLWSVQLN